MRFPAGVVSHFWERFGAQRPVLTVVEPEQADCLLQSARSGRADVAGGSVDSVMVGLACGQASQLAWRFLQPMVDFFMTVTDRQGVQAMRALAGTETDDIPVVSGELGAAGLAGLIAIVADSERAGQLALDVRSRVLLLNTAGATAPGVYESLTGRSAADVTETQGVWHSAGAWSMLG